jgi:hypothetical protein
MRVGKRAGAALLVALAMTSTACGSTVAGARSATGADGLSGGTRSRLAAGSADTDAADGATADVAGDATTAAGSKVTSAAGTAKTKAGGATGKAENFYRGITAKTISIGVGTTDVTKLAATYAPNSDTTDIPTIQESVDAIVAYMNKHGGIAGRQVVPEYHDFPIDELVVPAREQAREQAMCDDFTLDRPAFAAMPLVSASGVFNTCAAKRGLVSVDIANLGEPVDRQRFGEIGNVWYFPNWAKGERRERLVVSQLKRRGFFSKGAKLGVMIYDDPRTQRSYDNGLLPALKALGVTPVETFKWTAFDNGQAAVLRFRAAGVDHVLWGDCVCGGFEQSAFMTVADDQGYHPKIALSTDLNIGAMKGIGAPDDQMHDAVAFGWAPSSDGVTEDQPITPKAAECRQASKDAGLPGSADQYCEGLFFMKYAIEHAPTLDPQGFRTAVETKFAAYISTATFLGRYGDHRHDGATGVRDMLYDLGCECWTYTSKVIDVG